MINIIIVFYSFMITTTFLDSWHNRDYFPLTSKGFREVNPNCKPWVSRFYVLIMLLGNPIMYIFRVFYKILELFKK